MPSPLEEVKDPLWTDQRIKLWMKRDDLIHPVISGNKYRKLAFLLPEFKNNGHRGILSFGGLHSNHIHALAWKCKNYNIPLTVFIRSHHSHPQSPTLDDVRRWGAIVQSVSPKQYRLKDSEEVLNLWKNRYPGYLMIPEGGSHPKAPDGFQAMMQEIENKLPDPDLFICPVGTGATLAGMVKHKKTGQSVLGVSSLKSSVFHLELKRKWGLDKYPRWVLADQWHFGGYGQVTKTLLDFLEQFEKNHGILLDPLYNGKAMFAFYEYVKYHLIPPDTKVVFLHTGGMQGWRGIGND